MTIERIFGLPSARRSGVVLLVAAVLTAVYVIAPAGGIVDSIRVAAPIVAAGAVLFGIVIHQPERATALVPRDGGARVAGRGARHVDRAAARAVTRRSRRIADGFHALFWCLILLAVAHADPRFARRARLVRCVRGRDRHDRRRRRDLARRGRAVPVRLESRLRRHHVGRRRPARRRARLRGSVRVAANGGFREFSPLCDDGRPRADPGRRHRPRCAGTPWRLRERQRRRRRRRARPADHRRGCARSHDGRTQSPRSLRTRCSASPARSG